MTQKKKQKQIFAVGSIDLAPREHYMPITKIIFTTGHTDEITTHGDDTQGLWGAPKMSILKSPKQIRKSTAVHEF